jgi:hypothetical protein
MRYGAGKPFGGADGMPSRYWLLSASPLRSPGMWMGWSEDDPSSCIHGGIAELCSWLPCANTGEDCAEAAPANPMIAAIAAAEMQDFPKVFPKVFIVCLLTLDAFPNAEERAAFRHQPANRSAFPAA